MPLPCAPPHLCLGPFTEHHKVSLPSVASFRISDIHTDTLGSLSHICTSSSAGDNLIARISILGFDPGCLGAYDSGNGRALTAALALPQCSIAQRQKEQCKIRDCLDLNII